MKVLLTGATGFIGSAIVRSVIKSKSLEITLLPLIRDKSLLSNDLHAVEINFENLASFDARVLKNCDSLVHTAARVHITKDRALDPLAEYRRINRDATLELARVASLAGVKRFVFLSSIGVNGINSNKPFTEKDKVAPHDDYSLSKYEAEMGLLDIARNSKMEVVIIRPPLVYGPGAPGNFKTLSHWIKKPIPMPFGAIHNHRSFVALDNLIDFVLLCVNREKSPKAANEVFLVSDGIDVSTSDLLRKVAKAYKVKSRLIPVPVSIMIFAARLLRKSGVADRLFGNLQVDSSKARDLLDWAPIITMDKQLEKMAGHDQRQGEKQ